MSLCSGPLAAANAVHRPRVRRGIAPPCALASFPPEGAGKQQGSGAPQGDPARRAATATTLGGRSAKK